MTRFGPAGTSDSFATMGYRKMIDTPEYVQRMGLNAYEYQCGRGVRITEKAAREFGQEAAKHGIALSLHAPYYISLSGVEEEKRLGSIRYILESARAVRQMGGQRIVIHSGSCAKLSRQAALELAKDTMSLALRALDENGLGEVIPCPETMGKLNQLGNLEEVLELCTLDERMLPCIDFGHLNARTFGGVNSREAFGRVLDRVEDVLGNERMRRFHAHFSKIAYTEKGGEKAHLTFADTQYGPEFEPLAELLVLRGCSPTIICESAGTQAEDAGEMKRLYECSLKSHGAQERQGFEAQENGGL